MGFALGTPRPVAAQRRAAGVQAGATMPSEYPAAPALAAGIVGAVSAGLLLGGSVAVAAVDARDSERVSRGALLGVTALSVPTVAILTWLTRRRAHVPGFAALQGWGWAVWTGATLNSALQWALVLDDRRISPGLTIAAGAMGALGSTIHAFDALATARRAQMRLDYHLGPVALGGTLHF